MHVCPMVTGVVPHVGGPILPPGVPTVLIAGLPAAVIGGMCTCVGPPDAIAKGSATVLIGGRPAARMGDNCGHGGAPLSHYALHGFRGQQASPHLPHTPLSALVASSHISLTPVSIASSLKSKSG